MLELLKFFLGKLDFIAIASAARRRGNRRVAARLHLILVQSYEVLELYEILLEELQSALDSHKKISNRHCFYLNPYRVSLLLSRQSSNLTVMDNLTNDLFAELRLVDNEFAETYRSLISGKVGILLEAQVLLAEGRLPLAETEPAEFPASADGAYRTLWFSEDPPNEDRHTAEKYLHGFNGQEKTIFDVSIHDGEAFFEAIDSYFVREKPVEKLQSLKELTGRYRETLLEIFTLEDILTDIPKVRRHYSSLP